MEKLKLNLQHAIIADKKTLVAWDYDERLYKKLHFISGAIFKKHGIAHVELKAPWPHISAALVSAPLSREERDKFKMAGGIIKPKFVFKKFDILIGQETPFDYFSVEFNNPPEFDKFLNFAQEICGEDRVVKYKENRPHLSLWALKKGDHADVEKVLPEIQQEVKKFLQPFTPNKMSIWDDFEISEIETIGGVNMTIEHTWQAKVKLKYEMVIAEPTLALWHGGNLEFAQENISHKGGRWEHGPGLYLTTHYDTARKYAKGSRKFYQIVIRKGTNITEVNIPIAVVREFMDTYFVRSRKKDVAERIDQRVKDNKINADTFLNITFNEQAIKNTDTDKLREFLVKQGVDYSIVDNAFGWRERMIVLFNMRNIVSKRIVPTKEKIETFDLPTEWGRK